MNQPKCKMPDCEGELSLMQSWSNGIWKVWYQCKKCLAIFKAVVAVGDQIIEKEGEGPF